jgi:penicillin-binding protein-related factor A (putative recombinase)
MPDLVNCLYNNYTMKRTKDQDNSIVILCMQGHQINYIQVGLETEYVEFLAIMSSDGSY